MMDVHHQADQSVGSQMSRLTWILLLTGALAAPVAWYLLFAGQVPIFGAVAQSGPVNWTTAVIGYVATVAGVILGSAYRALRPNTKSSGQIENFRALSLDIIRSRDLWAGLVASPLVFGLLYRTLDGVTLSGLCVLALENGFCCHTVVSNLKVGSRR